MEENVAANAEPADNRRKKPNMTSNEKKQLTSFLMKRTKPDTNPSELQCAEPDGHSPNGLELSVGPSAPSRAHGGWKYKIIMKKGPFAVVHCSLIS
jgi:hypothetical protein